MRTTIDLPDRLYKQVKALAAMRGLKLKELMLSVTDAALETMMEEEDLARHECAG